MKSLFYSLAVVLLISFSSCGKNSSVYKALKAEHDSVLLVQEGLKKDINEFLAVIKHFDASIAKIQSEEAVRVQQLRTKLGSRENAMVNDNIAKFNAFLESTTEKKEKVQKELDFSNAKRREFEVRARSLAKELETMRAQVKSLGEAVQEKDANIEELNKKAAELASNLEEVKTEMATQASLIENHEKALFTAFYIAAPKSELKAKKVLTTKVFCQKFLFAEDFDHSVLTDIDARKNETIVLPNSVSGKVLSAHPRASYELEKIDNQKVLKILDAEKFWSVTKYLVIR